MSGDVVSREFKNGPLSVTLRTTIIRISFTVVLLLCKHYREHCRFSRRSGFCGAAVLISETRTEMTLFSAYDDFLATTLGAMSGVLRRLDYISRLKDENGTYAHWGLARTHGQHAAEAAVAQAHSMVFLQLLRTPIWKLLDDLETGHDEGGKATPEYLAELRAKIAALTPQNLAGGSSLHFKSVLEALLSVTGAQKPSSDRAA